MKYLVGFITCLTVLAGLWLIPPEPAQAESYRDMQIRQVRQDYNRWMSEHRLLQRLNNQAFEQRNRYPHGSPAWHNWNNKVNNLMRRMAVCLHNMRQLDAQYQQLQSGAPSQPPSRPTTQPTGQPPSGVTSRPPTPPTTSGWKPGDGLLGVKPGS